MLRVFNTLIRMRSALGLRIKLHQVGRTPRLSKRNLLTTLLKRLELQLPRVRTEWMMRSSLRLRGRLRARASPRSSTGRRRMTLSVNGKPRPNPDWPTIPALARGRRN